MLRVVRAALAPTSLSSSSPLARPVPASVSSAAPLSRSLGPLPLVAVPLIPLQYKLRRVGRAIAPFSISKFESAARDSFAPRSYSTVPTKGDVSSSDSAKAAPAPSQDNIPDKEVAVADQDKGAQVPTSATPSPTPAAAVPAKEEKKPGKIKAFFKKYGWLGVGIYSGIYFGGMPLFYVLINFNLLPIDPQNFLALIKLIGADQLFSISDESILGAGGKAAMALTINELFEVVRIPLAIWITVRVRALLDRRAERNAEAAAAAAAVAATARAVAEAQEAKAAADAAALAEGKKPEEEASESAREEPPKDKS